MKTRNRSLIGIWAIIAVIFAVTAACGGDPHEHDFSGVWKSNDTQHWKECPQDGAKDQTAPHDWDWEVTTPATTEAEGLETQTCTMCKKESGETQPIPKLTETPGTRPPTIATVSAGSTSLQLPGATSVTLSGSVDIVNGPAVKDYTWSVVAPPALPAGAKIENTSTDDFNAVVTGLNVAGTYKFQLEVTGSNDVKATSSVVEVTVNAALVPSTPDVSASTSTPNPTLAQGLTVALTGSAAVTNGTVKSYEWTTKEAPSGVTPVFAPLANNDNANTTVSSLTKAGKYVFELRALNNVDVAGTKTVTVTVKPMELTKDVTVTFPAFGANPIVINLNPIYTPNGDLGDGFNTSGIRFEIKDNKGNDNSKFPSGTIALSQASVLYGESTWPYPPHYLLRLFMIVTIIN